MSMRVAGLSDPDKTLWIRADQGHYPVPLAYNKYVVVTQESRNVLDLGKGSKLMHCTAARN
eukprot:12605234-Heterocapsa_arctica.AAC.1